MTEIPRNNPPLKKMHPSPRIREIPNRVAFAVAVKPGDSPDPSMYPAFIWCHQESPGSRFPAAIRQLRQWPGIHGEDHIMTAETARGGMLRDRRTLPPTRHRRRKTTSGG